MNPQRIADVSSVSDAAAAPEVLAALDRASRWLDALVRDGFLDVQDANGTTPADITRILLMQCTAALRAARGEG